MFTRLFITFATCLIGLMGFASSAAANCSAPSVRCSGQCVNLARDEDHCGACGNACQRGHECRQGVCKLVCPDIQLVCGNVCVTPALDELHCGGCGNQCANNEYCSHGQCVALSVAAANACPAGQRKCGGRCRDTKVDWKHCGTCGTRCDAGQICKQGQCQSACPAAVRAVQKGKGRPKNMKKKTRARGKVQRNDRRKVRRR